MSRKSLLSILHVLLVITTKTGVSGSGHSAEGADRRESSRIMTISELDHVYPQPSVGYVSYKGNTPVYSSAPSSSYVIQADSRERPGRQMLSALPPSYPLAMASSYGNTVGSSENSIHIHTDDHLASASEGWSSGGGGSGYVKGDCNSALGLLGVLGLISFLTNVLRHMSTTTARSLLPSRKKRSDMGRPEQHDHDNVEELNRVTNLMLPLFTAVAHAKDSLIPRHCVYREICEANESLVHTLGSRGYALGRMLTEQVAQMLTNGERYDKVNNKKKSQIVEWILEAGKLGRLNRHLCELQYEHCKILEMLPKYAIPSSVLQNQVHI